MLLDAVQNRAEEQSLARERAMGELAEHKQMCEELLAMVEGLQNKVAALEATQQVRRHDDHGGDEGSTPAY